MPGVNVQTGPQAYPLLRWLRFIHAAVGAAILDVACVYAHGASVYKYAARLVVP
jgi:hypothetical protein